MGRRLDAADTVDTATHLLHRLQAEGWTLASLEHNIEYGLAAEKGPKMPIEATVVIRLVPVRG